MLKAKPESKSPPQKHGELAVPIRLRDRHRRSQQYHVLGLPFFTKVEDVNDDLVCNSAALRRVISQGAPVDGGLLDRLMEILGYRNPRTYAKAVYRSRTLYRMLNSLIVRCPCFWESRNGGADLARYGFGWMIDRIIRDRYKNYIESQMWMTGEVREAMGLKDPGTEGRSFYYFHPVNFMRDVAGGIFEEETVLEFNPYFKKIFYGDIIGGSVTVTASPGFATVSDAQHEGVEYNGKFYGKPTGLFDEDYIHVGKYRESYEEYYHEGIDLRGDRVDIVSLVHAKVLAYGRFSSTPAYGNTLVLANTRGKGVYLLAHLKDKMPDLEKDSVVEPHQVVAIAGDTTTPGVSMAAHLHITYYNYQYTEGKEEIIMEEDGVLSWVITDDWSPNACRTNPFTHSGTKRENVRK